MRQLQIEICVADGMSGDDTLSARDLFFRTLNRFSLADIANALGLHLNTISRWTQTGEVPAHYRADFFRLLGIYTTKAEGNARDKDQFYTKPAVASLCVAKMFAVADELGVDLSSYWFIEPSAGCGWFFDNLPRRRRIGIDIEPKVLTAAGKSLICADFLMWYPPATPKRRYVVIGNPPFGLRGHLALQFINHSAGFADMVAFILPQLFDSDGKGVPGKRVKGFTLAHSSPLPRNSFQFPDGRDVDVSTIFQVWTRVNENRIKIKRRPTCASYLRVYSLSDGGTPSSTRNKAMIDKCDVYLPSTCFSGMGAYRRFDDLPNKRGYGVVIHKNKVAIKKLLVKNDWKKTAFPSTNGALNLRSSLICDVVVEGGFKDGE